MDNNNTPAAQPSVNPPAEPTAPQVQTPESSPDSKKMIMMFVIGLVIVIVLVGGIYFLLSKQQTTETTTRTTTKQPIVQAQPTPDDSLDALEKDLASLKADDTDSDFASIDQDLKQL